MVYLYQGKKCKIIKEEIIKTVDQRNYSIVQIKFLDSDMIYQVARKELEPMNYDPILNVIIDHYGEENQCRLAMEECSELIQAINKCLRYPNDEKHHENLIEEIADVSIMIKELKIIFGISDEEYKNMKQNKLNRVYERYEQEVRGV